jgi:hypothetical protein
VSEVTTNEAAERLRSLFNRNLHNVALTNANAMLDEALLDAALAERRATVERIRPRIARAFSTHAFEHESTESERGLVDFIRDAMLTILDEEAAR